MTQGLLIERLQILFSAGFVFLLFLLVAWSNGYFIFHRESSKPVEKLSDHIVFWSFGFFFLLQLLITPLIFEFWYYFYTLGEKSHPRQLTPELQGWANIFSILMCGIGMFLYFSALSKKNQAIVLGTFALKGWKLKVQDFFIACWSWFLSYPLVVFVGQIAAIILMLTYQNIEPEQVAVKQIKTTFTSTPLLIAMVLCVIFIVPAIEELLFRGFLQNWLKKYMKNGKAILLTSLIFASFHFSPSQEMGNIELLISLFVLSCFLGYVYERQKSLWAPISLHAVFNAVSILMIFFTER